MNSTIHERPGVYSSYDASSVVSARTAARTVGAAAAASKGTANSVEMITSYEEGKEIFGEDAEGVYGMSTLLRLLFANGAGTVKAVAVGKDKNGAADYAAAFAALEEEEGVDIVVCDSAETTVRGITTKTTSGGAADTTWRELTTILIVDEVIPTIRSALRARFARSKNTAQSRGAIRSQVVLELEEMKGREIVDDYGEVRVSALESDPTVCLVEFSFTVAHGLNRIYLTAHITV